MEEVKSGEILADKIAHVLTTTPLAFDPEDSFDVTKPSDIARNSPHDDDGVGENDNILSQFRKNNIDFLADVDERYAGKKTRRKELESSDTDGEDDLKDVNVGIDDDVESEGSGDDGSESDSSQDYTDEKEFGDDQEVDEDSKNHHKLFKDSGTNTQIKKGECVRNQMSLWENFLEIRIQLQKCLLTANKMPSHEHFDDIKQKSGSELTSKMEETKKNVANVLDKMILLQDILLKRYPETKSVFKGKVGNKQPEVSDEEIPSDTEDEMGRENDDTDDECTPAKKRKTNDYSEILRGKFDKYKPYAESVIQKWNDKTRLTSLNKNTSNAYSVIKQIEYALSNKEKILKKTQLKKSNYEILGEHCGDSSETHYPEIFDDDDFYHQLLRDLIECKSSDITDPVQLGRQWIQLQSLRSKMKKNVDTRATKGRKIRYAVHSKLVNFMAPIEEGDVWNEDAKKELYGSLFGNLHKD